MATTGTGPNPEHILQTGMGFIASKTLLSAVELEVFSHLAEREMTAEELTRATGLHARASRDFFDALVALGLLARAGSGADARYANTPDTATFLVKQSPVYLGGILEMANRRLYGFWGSLTEGLRTGLPQNEIKAGATGLFDSLYADPEAAGQFLQAMEAIQLGPFQALASTTIFDGHTTVCDLGGATGTLTALIVQAHPHLTGITFDLPPVEPFARANLTRRGVDDRVAVASGDFFTDPLPPADVYLMGNVLHTVGEADRRKLIAKAFQALPAGGMLVAIEDIIDDDRRANAAGLLMSLNMLIEQPEGGNFTGAQFDQWARAAGFARTELLPLAGTSSAAVAHKS